MGKLDLPITGLILTVLGINAVREGRKTANAHEHRREEGNYHLYHSAPSRYLLGQLAHKSHVPPQQAQSLIDANQATNGCLAEYQQQTRIFIAACVQNSDCNTRLRVKSPNGSFIFTSNYGLEGLNPDMTTVDYLPIRVSDVSDSTDTGELTEEGINTLPGIAINRIAISLVNTREALAQCRRRTALVRTSLASLSSATRASSEVQAQR